LHTYTGAGTYTVTMIAEHVNGCSDTTQFQVVAHPLPIASFSLMPAQSCTAPVTVQAINSSAGAMGYVWDLGNGTTSTLDQPTVTFDAPGTYTVQLTAMNQFGCTHTSSQQFTVHPTPQALFSALPNTGCTERPIVFTNSSINANTFQWWFGDGASSSLHSPQHAYAAPGSYTVMLVAVGAGGCTDTLTLVNGIVIHPSPLADFTSDTLATLDNAVRFTDLSQGADSFVWDFGDGTSSDERHPVHLFPGDGGGYTVCLAVVNSFGCPDTVCKFIALPEDPGIFAPNAFTPNADGLNDFFLPVLNGWSGWDYRLLIFDRWGEVIAETRDRAQGWDGRSRGRDAPIDVYVWRVVLERSGDAREFMGHVSLVR
jgi:gliding motility-associated-like protein